MLARSNFKLYYESVESAQLDHYQFNEQCISENGKVNEYSGLRGLYKQLFQDSLSGAEPRLQIKQYFTPILMQREIKSVDLVVIACGFQTNEIPIKNCNNNFVSLRKDVAHRIEVDQNLRVLIKQKGAIALNNVFGIGIGYGISTQDKEIAGEASYAVKADTVTVYQTVVGNRLFNALTFKSTSFVQNFPTIGRVISNENQNSKIESKSLLQVITGSQTYVQADQINRRKIYKNFRTARNKAILSLPPIIPQQTSKQYQEKYMDKQQKKLVQDSKKKMQRMTALLHQYMTTKHANLNFSASPQLGFFEGFSSNDYFSKAKEDNSKHSNFVK